ncbi:MAG: NAD(P)H-dependent glycerol-3-phosphate dehydrogenase, partial [Beijerinckiaceae bacterium]
GAGAWGTALANAFARDDRAVSLIARDPEHAREMTAQMENARRLPGVTLAATVSPTADDTRIAAADLIVLATPAQSVRETSRRIARHISPDVAVVSTAKGIDRASGRFPSAIIAEALPRSPVAALSGPSFAADVSRGLPTAVTLACADEGVARAIAEDLSTTSLRLYHATDMCGVEIGGAAKNVLAIAAGVVVGKGLGESARAALVARGFAELQRFAAAMGGAPETLMGLSGLGDVVLSCSSAKSRNFAFGEDLGRGVAPTRAGGGQLAEGAYTADILVKLATARSVSMPIAQTVAALIAGRVTVDDAVRELMTRPVRAER